MFKSRKTGVVDENSRQMVNSLNNIIDMYNESYRILRLRYYSDKYLGNGTIFVLTPILENLIKEINFGNITNLLARLEWYTISVANTTSFKFETIPIEIILSPLNPDTVCNQQILDCLSDLLTTIVRGEAL